MEHSDDVESSDHVVGYSPFSFNSSSSSSLFRPILNPNFGSLVSHLKNMVLRNPGSIVSQAKTIKDSNMDRLESDEAVATAFEEEIEAPVTVNDKNHQKKRPDLGLKRAKFSAKPMPRYNQPDEILEPEIDIDKLEDPVELFAAFERMENAKKELQRLKGQPVVEMDQNRASLPPRRPRPSLWGNPAAYKHRSYSLTGVPDNDEALMSLQETYDHSIMNPTREDAIPESNAVKFSPQTKVSDVKPAMGSKVSELDELLSYDYEGLDEDGVQNLLRDKLNIKFIDIGEPSLPDMPVLRRCEYGSLTEALPNVKDSISHVKDSSKAASSNLLNFSYQFRKSSNNQKSPSLSKSPLASISKLNKHISRLAPLKDPFSPIDFDSSQEVISYSLAQNRKQTDQIGKRKDSHESSRVSVNEEEALGAATCPRLAAGNSNAPNVEFGEQLNGVSHTDQLVTSKVSQEFGRSPSCAEDDIGVSSEKLPSVTAKRVALGDNSEERMNEFRQNAEAERRDNLFEIRSPADGEDNFAGLVEASIDGAAKDVDANTVPIEEHDQTGVRQSVANEVFNEGSAVVKANVIGGDAEMEEPLNTNGMLIEKPKKKTIRSLKGGREKIVESTAPSQENVAVNKGRKRTVKSNAAVSKEPKNKKRKVEGTRAEAGTNWEAGVRRSTRIRMRPLEFWRGERFLYGRIHESTVSVIGVKYASPAKNTDEPAVKVKSFVSNKYKGLIDLASSH